MAHNLFYFNPTCEMAVANGQASYMPPAHLRQFERDLGAIPLWLADETDIVLTEQKVPLEFFCYLEDAGFSLPAFMHTGNIVKKEEKHLKALSPWGWSPAAHKVLKPFKNYLLSEAFTNPMIEWKNEHRELLSRATGAQLAGALLALEVNRTDYLEIPAHTVKVTSVDELKDILNVFTFPILLKTPWSASGRGLFKIRDKHERAHENAWVLGKLNSQGALYAEPYLEKVYDLSFHFMISFEGVSFLGINFFSTDAAGRFTGCYLNYPSTDQLGEFPLLKALDEAVSFLGTAINKMRLNELYHGPVGVDGIIFRNNKGVLKLHPCIEVNLRHTMGLVNLSIREKVHPKSAGFWQTGMIQKRKWVEMEQSMPFQIIEGKIASGVFALTPPPELSGFMAWLQLSFR